MKHYASPAFWKFYKRLPKPVQKASDQNFQLLKADPRHPSLRLKKVARYWSVRIGKKYRAVGAECPKGIAWFWIGTHGEYDRIVRQ